MATDAVVQHAINSCRDFILTLYREDGQAADPQLVREHVARTLLFLAEASRRRGCSDTFEDLLHYLAAPARDLDLELLDGN